MTVGFLAIFSMLRFASFTRPGRIQTSDPFAAPKVSVKFGTVPAGILIRDDEIHLRLLRGRRIWRGQVKTPALPGRLFGESHVQGRVQVAALL